MTKLTPDPSSCEQGNCYCESGYMPKDGQCINPCPIHSIYNGKDCSCMEGFMAGPIHKQCVPKECPANSFREGDHCKCNPGLMSQGGECMNPCPEHAYFNGKGCNCADGYKPGPVGKKCVPV